jgi:hypothetical protein
MGIKGHYLVRFSAYTHKVRAEDIMNDPALQGTYVSAAVLAPLQTGLYTPPAGQ